MKPHLERYKAIARAADAATEDPFGLPPLDMQQAVPVQPPDAGQPFAEGDVFAELDHEARAATKDGVAAFEQWWKTLRRSDADLIRAFRDEYRQLAAEADARQGLAL